MVKNVNILIAGGGTGGHLFPAFAIGDRLEKEGAIITYIGSKYGIEKKYTKKLKKQLYLLNITGISRNLSVKSLINNLLFPIRFTTSYIRSIIIINKIKPKIIIGTGGYSSGIPILAGKLLNIKYVLHEQNSHPGITTKYLSKRAEKIFISYDATKKHISNQNHLLTGNPIRESLIAIDRKKACKQLGIDSNKKIIFILGGSQGSRPINLFLIDNYTELINKNIQIIWQTGMLDFKRINEQIKNPQIIIKSFIDDMAIPYSCSDIVISRAGALAIEEMKSFNKPMILIPYPNAANNHQKSNALELSNDCAAKLVEQHEMDKKLIPTIFNLLNDDSERKMIGNNAKKLYKSNSLDLISSAIKEILDV